MELFSKAFPADCSVTMRVVDGELRVSVHTPRPDPVWLSKYRDENRDKRLTVSDDELEAGLVALVEEDPGRGPSHYVRIPLGLGGLKGSQERKEKALQRLIERGVLVVSPLDEPVGRHKVGVFALGGLPSGNEGV
jgi:hypothetical protein